MTIFLKGKEVRENELDREIEVSFNAEFNLFCSFFMRKVDTQTDI